MRIFFLTLLTVCALRLSATPETPFRYGRLENGLTIISVLRGHP